MYKPESVLENEIHKIPWNTEIQTSHTILTRRPDLVLIKKKRTCHSEAFAVSTAHRVKMQESKNIEKYVHLARERKKL